MNLNTNPGTFRPTPSKPSMDNIIKLVKSQLGSHSVSSKDRFMEDLGAESMDLLNMVGMAEDTFGVELSEAKIADVRSIQDLYDLINTVKKGE